MKRIFQRLSILLGVTALFLVMVSSSSALAAPAGDVSGDGRTDLADVLDIARFALEGVIPPEYRRMDVDGNGGSDLKDSLYLLRYLCGEELPIAGGDAETSTPAPTATPESTPAPTPTASPAPTDTTAPVATTVPLRSVSFEGQFSVDADAVYVDFGEHTVRNWADVVPFLRQLPNLQKCDMFASVIERRDVEALAAAFPQVEFGWTMLVADECWTNALGVWKHTVRTDAEVFTTFHNSYSPEHTSADFSVLRFCKNLKAIDIGHNQLDDISFLSGLTELRILIIAVTHNVTDISPLANLTRLEYLELFYNRISDISPLANLTNLKDLNLSQNYITDYTPLYGLTQLERLWLWNSNNRNANNDTPTLPMNTVYALQEALPNCLVRGHHDYGATAGDWRNHPRYNWQYRIFSTGVFEAYQE